MKRTSTLKRGNGFKKVVGNSLKTSKTLKRSSFKRTLSDIQKDVKESDSKFSKFIINRDKKCMNCGSTQMLTCSHWEGRSNYATRYSALNCITFCMPCHDFFESKKNGLYKDLMFSWLGQDNFTILEHLIKMKISKTDSLILAHKLLDKVETNSDIQY